MWNNTIAYMEWGESGTVDNLKRPIAEVAQNTDHLKDLLSADHEWADGSHPFVPDTPADWDTSPSTLKEALNELASRLRAVE